MAGLSQLELDALCCSGGTDDEAEAPPSPQDSCLRKRRRRVTFSAMGAEIAALRDADVEETEGLTQKELDGLGVSSNGDGDRSSSPIGSTLRRAKRTRLSVGDGSAGALAQASELLSQAEPAGLSQAELDALTSPTPPKRNTQAFSPARRRRVKAPTDENKNVKTLTDENGSKEPASPVHSLSPRKRLDPLSPVKIN
eukprot:CAMPEP_0197663648 /NCGR_PEP_ID=MMETSP1338-20131121/58160_1 /TAXON_ID=43686 ORGANISM="Pelagodinium beii, Strain RCC1491" /NCGR_SAMPLE_ID=MMETSP1338 /ASSEMBLY_ACC=CAM_ASM_000754 /LENGTH=196 /DNA_ID=CAMNT_0043242127 /DNA_START=65 /DNA_END=655 /DNA_ORIENTATION=+